MSEYRSFAVIVYVTETEKQAVMRMYDWSGFRIEKDSQEYKEAFIEKNGKKLRIISAQQDEMGMTASAALSTKMIMHFAPEYIIMPGIAAGTGSIAGTITDSDNQEFGDVLLADSVWNYSNGKYVSPHEAEIVFGEIGFKPRPTMVKIGGDHIAPILAYAESNENEFFVHYGPLARGTAVVANQSLLQKQIVNSFENTKGVEMEAYGVAYAAEHAPEPRPRVIIAKSICDFGDERKNDVYQKFAAYTSCGFCEGSAGKRSHLFGIRAKEDEMIINTGQRTDIPAFYAEWFANRLKEGFVCVRNPYNPGQVSRYRLDPTVVDVIGFCTKNPAPMFPYMELLKDYGQYWFVTITGYGRDIEPNVPDKHRLLEDFRTLSDIVGIHSVGWRYDPVFISEKYTVDYHLRAFEQIAAALESYTETAVISFIDLYPKVRRNFPEAREVTKEQRLMLGREFVRIASAHGMTLKPCAEGDELADCGADCGGCMKISDYEKAIGRPLNAPKKKGARAECACYLSCDIGAYNTCRHLCRYCYANAEPAKVMAQSRLHDPGSPFLVGGYREDDRIHDVPQSSWIDGQESLMI